MKADFMIPFVEATSSICEEISGKSVSRGELSVQKDLVTTVPINIVCGISGEIEGIALLGLSKETAMKIASLMIGSDLRVFDNAVSAVLVELGNRIVEASTDALSQMGFQFRLTPSVLVRGMSISISTNDTPALIVPLNFANIGTVEVKLSVRLNKTVEAA